jgi:hypothetical protein
MLGLTAFCIIGFFPPWRLYGPQSVPLGFAPILAPPTAALSGGVIGQIDLDFSRLALEIFVLTVLTGGLMIIGGSAGAVGTKRGSQGGFMATLAAAQAQARETMRANQEQSQQSVQKAAAPVVSVPLDPRFTRVELPANYYLGELLVESDEDPEYWDSLCPARGVVDVPKGKKVQLELAKDIRVDLAVLGAFPAGLIDSIDASECKLTDEDVSKLTVMSGLRELDLTGTPITSGSVTKLRALGRLERLWLDRTLINDDCVPALASLSKLKKLSLTETKLNDLSLETLRKDLGDCEVVS